MTCTLLDGSHFLLNGPVGGHLFVLRGDLTQLQCSAILVPCDNNWELVANNWSPLLQMEQFEPATWGARLKGRSGGGRFVDLAPNNDRKIRLVVTADGRDDPLWVAAGVVEAIETFTSQLHAVGGRVKPLVGMPLVGTGAGGFRYERGRLIRALLPALRKASHSADVDVALVLLDGRDHAAIQGQRTADDWTEFSAEHLAIADRLGVRAARDELALFLGAGVSIPLGLPDWKTLLAEIAGEALPDYSPDSAPHIAQELREKVGRKRFYDHIAERVSVRGCAPAHLLLAGLNVRQAVTSNYDTAYERALDSNLGANAYRVLTRQLAAQPDPWLLKIHGDACRPETIVLTSDDYAQLKNDHGALQSVVESLLMTSHLMFVGYSMGDPDFVEAAERVRTVRALADEDALEEHATVLALHSDAVSTPPDFATVAMLDERNDGVAARRLEIFLDRISWTAARHGSRSHVYLLDPDYQDLFADDPATTRLRHVLAGLLQLREGDPARTSRGWAHVENMLLELGGRPRIADFD
jgi:hypothetical protein